ncbi:META domain-containing protein [Hymenobacter wooponensis]|uniref:META domain-containing protein n=1 Tax=Hymenobacter wooponensis TaxID=1525360 RepID=A0A4Z0MQ44_9BACT|nr:META domain-containing protein [Hymenobacter wooponensis]TGD81539.1 META domain-containing protein [Hymenobacter wooponensis]
MRLAILSLFTLGLITSCQRDTDTPPPAAQLEDTRWMLVQVEEVPLATSSYSETSRSYLLLASDNHKTEGLAPCNSFGGTYSLGGAPGTLTISGQTSTKATCPAQTIEMRYLSALPLTARYEISGEQLRFYGPDNSLTPKLVFERVH